MKASEVSEIRGRARAYLRSAYIRPMARGVVHALYNPHRKHILQ